MNYITLAEKFWHNGYIVLDNFYDELIMSELNDKILDHYGMNPDWEHSDEFVTKSQTEVVPWFPVREGDHSFDIIEKDPRLVQLTEAILGEGWKGLYLMAMFSKQGTKGQAWHQDCPPENNKTFNLNRLFYTHDINDATGGKTIVMPGSHKQGVLTKGDPHEDLEGQVVLAPKQGTLVILHGHAWHRVKPIKGNYRLSVNSRAIPTGTPEEITDIAVYRNMRYKFSTSEVVEDRS